MSTEHPVNRARSPRPLLREAVHAPARPRGERAGWNRSLAALREAASSRGLAFLLAVLSLAGLPLAGPVGWSAEDEYRIKAAFLYQFTSFVTWPKGSFEDDEAPFVVGVLGDDPFDGALVDAVKEKRFQGRRFEVVVHEELDELEPCHLLFVTDGMRDELPEILEVLDEASTLLVGESDGFAGDGGAINFYFEKKKTRFEINADAAKRAGLKISAKLLDLARLVKDRRGDDE